MEILGEKKFSDIHAQLLILIPKERDFDTEKVNDKCVGNLNSTRGKQACKVEKMQMLGIKLRAQNSFKQKYDIHSRNSTQLMQLSVPILARSFTQLKQHFGAYSRRETSNY